MNTTACSVRRLWAHQQFRRKHLEQPHPPGKFFLALSASLLLLAPQVVDAQEGPKVLTGGISFSGLTGPNLAPYNGNVEGEFAIAPASGNWYQAMFYGS